MIILDVPRKNVRPHRFGRPRSRSYEAVLAQARHFIRERMKSNLDHFQVDFAVSASVSPRLVRRALKANNVTWAELIMSETQPDPLLALAPAPPPEKSLQDELRKLFINGPPHVVMNHIHAHLDEALAAASSLPKSEVEFIKIAETVVQERFRHHEVNEADRSRVEIFTILATRAYQRAIASRKQ